MRFMDGSTGNKKRATGKGGSFSFLLHYGPILEPEGHDTGLGSESLAYALPFLHCKLTDVQPFIEKLGRPPESPGKFRIRDPIVCKGHFYEFSSIHNSYLLIRHKL